MPVRHVESHALHGLYAAGIDLADVFQSDFGHGSPNPAVIPAEPTGPRAARPDDGLRESRDPYTPAIDAPIEGEMGPGSRLRRVRDDNRVLDVHHFSVSTSPRTNSFCIRITTATGGSIASMAVAITSCHSVSASEVTIIFLMPITMVCMSSRVVMSSGQRY